MDPAVIPAALLEQFSASSPVRWGSDAAVLSLLAGRELAAEYAHGGLVEVVGPSASGKTQLCLQLAAEALLDIAWPDARKEDAGSEICDTNAYCVVYVDTSGDFCSPRLVELLNQAAARRREEEGYELSPKAKSCALSKMLLCRCFDAFELFELLEALLHRDWFESAYARPRQVIVDSIAPLFGPLLQGKTNGGGHSLMIQCARMLRMVGSDYKCPALVTNGVRSDGSPQLGRSWRSAISVRISLLPLQKPFSPSKGRRPPSNIMHGSDDHDDEMDIDDIVGDESESGAFPSSNERVGHIALSSEYYGQPVHRDLVLQQVGFSPLDSY